MDLLSGFRRHPEEESVEPQLRELTDDKFIKKIEELTEEANGADDLSYLVVNLSYAEVKRNITKEKLSLLYLDIGEKASFDSRSGFVSHRDGSTVSVIATESNAYTSIALICATRIQSLADKNKT